MKESTQQKSIELIILQNEIKRNYETNNNKSIDNDVIILNKVMNLHFSNNNHIKEF